MTANAATLVAIAFTQGKSLDKGTAIYCEKSASKPLTIYSYSKSLAHYELREDCGEIHNYIMLDYIKGESSSHTTSRHMRALERVLDISNDHQWFSSIGTYGGWRVNSFTVKGERVGEVS